MLGVIHSDLCFLTSRGDPHTFAYEEAGVETALKNFPLSLGIFPLSPPLLLPLLLLLLLLLLC
jgi:hypothetical protein